jgi:hypothetical protein
MSNWDKEVVTLLDITSETRATNMDVQIVAKIMLKIIRSIESLEMGQADED